MPQAQAAQRLICLILGTEEAQSVYFRPYLILFPHLLLMYITHAYTGAYLSSSLASQLDHDVALVRLDWPIGYRTGWLGVTARCRDGETLTLRTAGYPGEFNDTSNTCVETQCPVTFLPAQAAQVRRAR